MDSNTYNNASTGDTHNDHNPLTGDKTRSHPSQGTRPITEHTGEHLDRNKQQAPDSYRTNAVGVGEGLIPGANIDHSQDPSTGRDIASTQNPTTDHKTDPNRPQGTGTLADHPGDRQGNLGPNEQHPSDSTGATGKHANSHTDTSTGGGLSAGTDPHDTHNPMTGDKTGPHPPPGVNLATGRTNDDDLGRHEQQHVDYNITSGARSDANPPPPPGTNPVTERTRDDDLDRNAQQASDPHRTNKVGTGTGATAGTNAPNPTTGLESGPNRPQEINTTSGRSGDRHGNFLPTDQQATDYTGAPGTHAGRHAGADEGLTSSVSDTRNVNNPPTGDGATYTHNPVTGDKTGSHPGPTLGMGPTTGHRDDGNISQYKQPVNYNDTTGALTGANTTGAHPSVSARTGTEFTSGTDKHNTHNPLTGGGDTNTHNPLTGDKTGLHPPPGTNPATGRTNDGNLGRNEQQSTGNTRTTGVAGTGPHDNEFHDNTRGAHTTGAGGTAETGPHSTSTNTTGSGTKAALGRVEATIGAMLNNSEMHAKGMKKQDEAQTAKLAKEQEVTHGGANVRH